MIEIIGEEVGEAEGGTSAFVWKGATTQIIPQIQAPAQPQTKAPTLARPAAIAIARQGLWARFTDWLTRRIVYIPTAIPIYTAGQQAKLEQVKAALTVLHPNLVSVAPYLGHTYAELTKDPTAITIIGAVMADRFKQIVNNMVMGDSLTDTWIPGFTGLPDDLHVRTLHPDTLENLGRQIGGPQAPNSTLRIYHIIRDPSIGETVAPAILGAFAMLGTTIAAVVGGPVAAKVTGLVIRGAARAT